MNNKNKVLLTSIGLAIFTGIAATSTTFAWFTTTQNASLSYSSATVTTKDNSLAVQYKSSKNTLSNSEAVENEIVLTGANQITDISGDGLNFYKPKWNAYDTPSNRLADSISEVGAVSADGYYVDFTITISRTTSGSNGMKVYLGPQTEIEAASSDAEDVTAVAAARLAVIGYSDGSSTTGNASVKFIYVEDDDAEYKHLAPVDGEEIYSVEDYDSVAVSSPVIDEAFVEYTSIVAADAGTIAIADLSSVTSVDVTFRAWLEGEDADAVNAAIGGIFNVNLDLYGLTVSA